MIKFSASEAALEGFRLTRERPGTIFGWGVVYAICMTVIGQLMLLSLDPELIELTRSRKLDQADVERVSNLLAQSLPAFALVSVLAVTLLSCLMGGIYRLVLRPGEKGFLHLRFGMDELRLTAVNLLLFAVGMAFLTAEIAAFTAMQQGSAIAAIAAAVLLLASVWVGVRLTLATPMTFAEHRFAIRDAWRASRGRFWPLLGMVVLAAIFYFMIWLLISVIGAALIAIAGGAGALDNLQGINRASVAGVVLYVLQLILWVIQLVMIYAPFGVAYQQIHGDLPANPLRARPQDT